MSSNINPPLVSYLISSFTTLRRHSTSSVTQIASYLSVSHEFGVMGWRLILINEGDVIKSLVVK